MSLVKSPWDECLGLRAPAHTPLLVSGCVPSWPQKTAQVKANPCVTWQGPPRAQPASQGRSQQDRGAGPQTGEPLEGFSFCHCQSTQFPGAWALAAGMPTLLGGGGPRELASEQT